MGRVLIRNSDGYPIEYQQYATEGILIANAILAGLNPIDYTEQEISEENYKILAEEKIYAPARAIQETENLAKREAIKTAMGWTDAQLDAILDLSKNY